MSIVVEDGTGKADAESYVSAADANAYAASHGLTFAIAGDDAALAEAALRRATTWLDAEYGARFPGQRNNGRGQALQWPRSDAVDAAGEEIASDEVPAEIVAATIEAAVREKASPGSLSPDVTPGKVKTRAKVGEIEVEYAASGSVAEQRPVLSVVDGILSGLLEGSIGASVDLLRV
jgi:hypothetical protein